MTPVVHIFEIAPGAEPGPGAIAVAPDQAAVQTAGAQLPIDVLPDFAQAYWTDTAPVKDPSGPVDLVAAVPDGVETPRRARPIVADPQGLMVSASPTTEAATLPRPIPTSDWAPLVAERAVPSAPAPASTAPVPVQTAGDAETPMPIQPPRVPAEAARARSTPMAETAVRTPAASPSRSSGVAADPVVEGPPRPSPAPIHIPQGHEPQSIAPQILKTPPQHTKVADAPAHSVPDKGHRIPAPVSGAGADPAPRPPVPATQRVEATPQTPADAAEDQMPPAQPPRDGTVRGHAGGTADRCPPGQPSKALEQDAPAAPQPRTSVGIETPGPKAPMPQPEPAQVAPPHCAKTAKDAPLPAGPRTPGSPEAAPAMPVAPVPKSVPRAVSATAFFREIDPEAPVERGLRQSTPTAEAPLLRPTSPGVQMTGQATGPANPNPQTGPVAVQATPNARVEADALAGDPEGLRLDSGPTELGRAGQSIAPASPTATTPSAPQPAGLSSLVAELRERLVSNGTRVTEVTLRHLDLGEVRVTLSGSDLAGHMLLQAERPETETLFRRHADLIREELQATGWQSVDLSFGDQAGERHAQAETGEAPANQGEVEMTVPAITERPARATPATSAGGLDLRV